MSKIKARISQVLSSPHQQILERIRYEKGPTHADATSWRHMGVNEHAIVMRVYNWVAFSLVPHQNAATLKELFSGTGFHIRHNVIAPLKGDKRD